MSEKLGTHFARRDSVGLPKLLIELALARKPALKGDVLDRQGRFEQQHSIAPGKALELCGRLPQGIDVRWSFEASGPTEFNIHYHQGEKVVYRAKRIKVSRARDRLHASLEQDYCWMWHNKSPHALTLRAALAR